MADVRALGGEPEGGDTPGHGGSPDARLFVNSLEKGLRLLRCYRDGSAGMTIAELAGATGLGRSATQRFVYTLEQLGYLVRDPVTRAYRLTFRVLDLGYGYLHHDILVEQGTHILSEVARLSEEAASLTELDDLEIVVLSRVPSQHLFSVNVVQGMRFPTYCSAPGRAMLAFLPVQQATDVIERSDLRAITPHTITDRSRLLDLIAQARSTGYELAVEELFLGTLSLAVPVLGRDGTAAAALNLFCPTARWPPERAAQELAPVLMDKARELSSATCA